MTNINFWKFIVNQEQKENNKINLIFIHTPKCGGSYTSQICRDLKIINKRHNQAIQNEGINFTIIRNPVDRFESLLNYRLDENAPRGDWPRQLDYVYNDKNITLNEIVSKMSDNDIKSFTPYNSLIYWTKNVDILITIDQLPALLHFFGYNYNPKNYTKINVSNKLNHDDVLLFEKVVKSYY